VDCTSIFSPLIACVVAQTSVFHFDLSHDLIPVSANAAAAVGQELVLELPG
jgi:hypothetical protein